MPSIGAAEIVIILVLALLVFGPKRLPEMGRSLGRTVREFKKASDTARKEFGVDEIEKELKDVKKSIGDVKSDLKVDVDAEVSKKKPDDADVAAAGAASVGAATPPEASPASPGDTAADATGDDSTRDADEVLVGEIVDYGAAWPEPSGDATPVEDAEPAGAASPAEEPGPVDAAPTVTTTDARPDEG
jgi:TatA/E family protein of Tat protein translocase